MEISSDQKQTIVENLQKLSALASVISYMCVSGVPSDDVLSGWDLLLWDIKTAIHQIIEPETAEGETDKE